MRLRFATSDNGKNEADIPLDRSILESSYAHSCLGRYSRQVKGFLEKFDSHYTKFAVAKTFSAFLALIFSVLYSRQLGTDSRGIVSALFLTSLILSEVLLGAINLKIRTTHLTKLNTKVVSDYIVISLFVSLLIGTITSCSLIAYSELKTNIATPFILISFIYGFVVSCLIQLVNLELSFGNFSLVWRLELACVAIQVGIYLCLSYVNLFSISINLIVSVVASYIFVVTYELLNLGLNYLSQLKLSLRVGKQFVRLSHGNAIYIISTSILDRLDRIVVLILFTSTTFAKFSVLTGLVLFFRFIPDFYSKIVLSKRITRWNTSERALTWLLSGAVFVAIPIGSIFVNLIIRLILGPEWVLPIEVVFMVIFSEFLRAIFIIRINTRLATLSFENKHSTLSLSALVTSIIVSLVCLYQRNLIIIPLAMTVGYTYSFILSTKFEK